MVAFTVQLLHNTKMVNIKPKPLFLHKMLFFMATGISLIYLCTASPRGKNESQTKVIKAWILPSSRVSNNQDSQQQTCETKECYEAAQNILNNMDTNVQPCDNFYDFACGKFMKRIVITGGAVGISLFSDAGDRLKHHLKQSIEGKLEEGDPKSFERLQSYYNVCLNLEKIERTSINEAKNILSNLGNWPVMLGKSWNELNFDWIKLIYQLRNMGYIDSMNSIVKFDIEIDQKNTTRYIITLDQAATGIAHEYLSKGVEDKVVQAYKKYMIELTKILGSDREVDEGELAESLEFEIGLAKYSLATPERRNMSQLYNLKTIRQLQSEYPYIPWSEYLNQLVSPQSHIDFADEVVVKVPSFLESLSQLLSKTPKRVLANYILWRVVQESADYMDYRVRKVKAEFQASMTGANAQQSRWAQCIKYVSNNLPVATGALYVRRNFDKKSKIDIQNLVNDLRGSFEDTLKNVDWMDQKTKIAALVKLNSMRTHVAYPDELFDNEKLDEHFESLEVDANSFLKSHLNSNLFNLGYKLEKLRKPADENSWLTGLHGKVAIVNANYESSENSIQIMAGILQGGFFASTRPKYMNYGAIGIITGHEMTHGFDDKNSQFDKDGNLFNWWDVETKEEYAKRAQCIIDQYSNYSVSEVGLNLNGKNTQGENIADNGGVKVAYFAYQSYEKQNGEESRLPGLPYSPRQLFWISAANVFCEKLRPEAVKNRVITDVHSPGKFRVIGPLSNMPQFARDFNCPLGSPMNPVKKCTVW